MAISNGFLFIMLFFLATAIVITSALEPEINEETDIAFGPAPEDYALAPEPDYVDIDGDGYYDEEGPAIPPQPSAEYLEFLNECVSNITAECAKEVFTYMFEDLTVTEECCGVLVAMGEPCHISLVKTIFSIPEYKSNASLGIPRSKQLWNKCSLIAAAPASSPTSLEY